MKALRSCLVVLSSLSLAAALLPAQTPPAASAPGPGQATPRVNSTGGRSPHETTSATIGGREGPRITITYGRPFSKHPRTGEMRTVWGGLVPWDKPWRLGADEATLLLTQAPLQIGETTIPAGAHTLYLVPSQTGVSKLAFSSAIGKWGAPVDETKDIARVDLKKAALDEPVDQLTITVRPDPSGAGGTLAIRWEKTEFTLPFTIAR